MNENRSMAGWIGFASMLLLLVGVIDFFQGLVAVFEDEYFVVTPAGFLAVDLTTWGWTMMVWGVLLVNCRPRAGWRDRGGRAGSRSFSFR